MITKMQTKLFMLVLVLSSLLAAITVDMVNPVLPLLGEDLNASKSQVSWVVSGIALVLAIGVPLYGRMSDLFELRKLYFVAVSILTVGSLLCALAPNLGLLVLGRMIQGAGMAAIPVLSVVAISQVYPAGQRGAALGIVAGCIGIGTAFGPIIGGAVGQFLGWPALFWMTFILSAMIAAGSVYAIPKFTPASEDTGRGSIDLVGGVLLGLAVGLLLYGITEGEHAGFGSFPAVASLAASLFALLGLIRRMNAADNPFVPPDLFKNKPYARSVVVAFFSMFAYFAALVYVPLLVIEVNGLTPGEAGLTLLPGGAAVAILSPVVGRISDRIGAKRLILAGVSMMGISTLFLSAYGAGASPFWVSAGVLGVCVGSAFTNAPANNAAVGSLVKERIGVGMGIFQGALFLGAGTGAGIVGAVLSARRDASSPLNPLYPLDAFPYSDAFLAATAALLVALAAGIGLRKEKPAAGRQVEE